MLTLGLSDSPGVPATTAAATLTARYNDLASVKALFEANKGEIAGLILEPVVGNSGFIPPTKEFLQGLRDMCTEVGGCGRCGGAGRGGAGQGCRRVGGGPGVLGLGIPAGHVLIS